MAPLTEGRELPMVAPLTEGREPPIVGSPHRGLRILGGPLVSEGRELPMVAPLSERRELQDGSPHRGLRTPEWLCRAQRAPRKHLRAQG